MGQKYHILGKYTVYTPAELSVLCFVSGRPAIQQRKFCSSLKNFFLSYPSSMERKIFRIPGKILTGCPRPCMRQLFPMQKRLFAVLRRFVFWRRCKRCCYRLLWFHFFSSSLFKVFYIALMWIRIILASWIRIYGANPDTKISANIVKKSQEHFWSLKICIGNCFLFPSRF